VDKAAHKKKHEHLPDPETEALPNNQREELDTALYQRFFTI